MVVSAGVLSAKQVYMFGVGDGTWVLLQNGDLFYANRLDEQNPTLVAQNVENFNPIAESNLSGHIGVLFKNGDVVFINKSRRRYSEEDVRRVNARTLVYGCPGYITHNNEFYVGVYNKFSGSFQSQNVLIAENVNVANSDLLLSNSNELYEWKFSVEAGVDLELATLRNRVNRGKETTFWQK